MQINIPEFSMVMLVGATSSGKSTFARKHFLPNEIISSDYCRALVSDDENSMEATSDAFDVLHYILAKRLKRKKLTVIDATNVQSHARQSLVKIAREYHCLPVVIMLNVNEKILRARHELRPDRDFGAYVIKNHVRDLRSSFGRFKKEGIRIVHELKSPEEIDSVQITRSKLWNNKKEETGPFDIIGDVHGCADELELLLEKLGYQIERDDVFPYGFQITPPEGRKAFFVGDLTDRGPDSPRVLKIVMSMVEQKNALCVCGNHDDKLLRKLNGRNVKLLHGLAETMEQLEKEPEEFLVQVRDFLKRLVSHYVVDDGKLVVAHAGITEELQGRASGKVRSFCLYGDVTGQKDKYGMPIRLNWAADYRGKAMVVYGHTPKAEAEWLNHTMNIDTGCVFGGKLTGLRYPEREIIQVDAKELYCEPSRPFLNVEEMNEQHENDDVLDIQDVIGRRVLDTKLRGKITLREENAIAALEVMSRFAIHPKWLIHLPPTMSPTETSQKDNFLEHPEEAFKYYIKHGVEKVICEEKHMGSRGLIIVCKDEEVAKNRFGLLQASNGVCFTRTGRPFFKDTAVEKEILQRLQVVLEKANFWKKLDTDWVLLDCEIMPWSFKAQSLIKDQYAAVGSSGLHSLDAKQQILAKAKERGLEVDALITENQTRLENIKNYQNAYRAYCSETNTVDDIVIAPFHVLATEGQTHVQKTHDWHMKTIHEFCAFDKKLMKATTYHIVDLTSEVERQKAIDWWLDLTKIGGEGMVVKSLEFINKSKRGEIIQPAIKCRGQEYLRIIYGPDYTLPHNLKRLRKRGLGRKRSMAMREFVLGIEALERFVKKEPLRKVHECVFGVLALESEAVDPRL